MWVSGTDNSFAPWWRDAGEPAPEFWVRFPGGQIGSDNAFFQEAFYKSPDPQWRSEPMWDEWRPWIQWVESGAYNADGQPYYMDRGAPPGRIVELSEFVSFNSAFWLTRYDFQRAHWLRAFAEILAYGRSPVSGENLVEQTLRDGYFARFASFHDLADWRRINQQNPAMFVGASYATPGEWIGHIVREMQAARDAAHTASTIMIVSILAAPIAYYVGLAAMAESSAATATLAETTATVSGAELAGLVEAGAVGAEGAILESAALSGAAVTYSTTTGAILSSGAAPGLPQLEQAPPAPRPAPSAPTLLDTIKGTLVGRLLSELAPKPDVTARASAPAAQSPGRIANGGDPLPALILAGAVLALFLS